MTPQQFAKLESIYHEAAIAPPDVQQRLIRETALEDPLVGQKLAEMLAVSPHGGARDVTEHLHASDLSESTSEPSVVRVGTYSVIRTIGQGGMGTVYEAQQAEPRRRVALKLLSIGGRSAAVLRRFRRESSILARLQHPGIAQIFDAGFGEVEFAANRSGMQPAISTAPFFTMELVDGQNICAAATALRLDTAARLQLLAAVCDSVQHAHQQGIIHRDLKPANILLASTETLQPKVLDFGIARMIGDNALTGVTEFGQIIGTLAYMSPEQVAGDSSRVDTRSDVYALGACLYELLAGQPAFDTVNRPITDVIRMIRESNVPRLGNKHPQFRGDVETIVAKAMDRERERRYGSAAELAADIRRYLRDEPILARPNSTLYQLRKFARRNRTLVGSAGIVLVTLVAGLIISTGLYFRAQEETVRAEKATEFARAREREAQQQAYLATLAAAAAALQDNDVVGARTHLERAPLDLRGWEWRHFWSRLDDSTSCFRADDELMDWSALHWQSNPPAIQVSLAGENRGLQNIELSSPYQSTVVRDARRGPGQFSPDGKHSVAVLADRSLTGDSLDKPWLPDIPPSAIVCYPSISSDGTIAFGIYRNAGLEQIEIRRTNGSTARITSPPARFAQVLRHDIVAIYGGDSARFWLWFADSGEVREHRVASPVRALSVGEDESRFVLGLEDGTFEMRAVADGAHISGGGRHEGAVSAVAINPDGTIIASAGIDRTVRLWNVVSSGDSRILLGHTEPVRSLTFSADGTQLASAGDDRQIRIWQISQLRDPSVLRGHSNYVYPVAFSPGGEWLASASWDGTVRIWPIKSGEPIVLESNMQSPLGLLWHPHRKCVVVYGLNKNNRYSCEAIGFDGYNVHGTWGDESVEVRPAGFLKDSDTLIVEWRNEQSEVRGWSIGDGRSWIERMQPRWLDGLFIPDRVDELSVLFDSSGDSRPLFQVVNCLTQIPLWSFVATTSRTFAIEQTCGDRHRIAIISTTNPREILIRDLRTGRIVTTLRGHTDEVLALAWSPDGSRVASAGRDRLIRIWDAQNWWQLAQLAGHTSYVWSLAFSPDGALLASGSGDKTVRLWRIAGP